MDYEDAQELKRAAWETTRLLRGVKTLLAGLLIPIVPCGIAATMFIMDRVSDRYQGYGWLAYIAVIAAIFWYVTNIGKDADR